MAAENIICCACVGVGSGGVIYGFCGMDYLTVGVLRTDGAHAGRLVVVIGDGGVQKAIKTLAIRDARGAWSRRTVGRTSVFDASPAPKASGAQHTGVVVHAVVTAVTVA